jgi:hypothetical protein
MPRLKLQALAHYMVPSSAGLGLCLLQLLVLWSQTGNAERDDGQLGALAVAMLFLFITTIPYFRSPALRRFVWRGLAGRLAGWGLSCAGQGDRASNRAGAGERAGAGSRAEAGSRAGVGFMAEAGARARAEAGAGARAMAEARAEARAAARSRAEARARAAAGAMAETGSGADVDVESGAGQEAPSREGDRAGGGAGPNARLEEGGGDLALALGPTAKPGMPVVGV